jgi:hypothetical protein
MDVIAARERTSREGEIVTHWVRLGSAWNRDKGGLSVELDALPIADGEGRVRFLIVEPQARQEEVAEERQPAPAPAAAPRNGAERYQQQRQANGRSRF